MEMAEVYRAFDQVAHHCPDANARTYASNARNQRIHTMDDLQLQAEYVLGNMTHWRGMKASWCRAVLKAFCKPKRS